MSVEPYDGEQPALYVSYAREDWDVVAPEVEALQRLGLRVWFPPDDSDELGDAAGRLKAAPFVLVFVTPDALESEPVRQEVSLTLQESKDALAVHLVETPMQGPNGLLLGRLQTVNKYRMTDGLYRRRIAKSAPDAVKSREIEFEDAPQAPPPSRARREGAGGGPFEGVDPKVLWGGAIGGVVLLLGLLAMVLLGGSSPTPSAEGPRAEAPGATDAGAAEAERIREERAQKEREALEARRKEREEAERQAKVRQAAREKTAAAQRLLDAGEYEQAIAAFGEALELDPAQVAALSGRGRARSLSGDDQGALVDLERAVGLARAAGDEEEPGTLTEVLMERAAVRAALDDYAGAIADYSAVIERAPNSGYAYAKRGDSKRRQGDYAGAVADYDQAIELDPRAAAVYYSRGLARKELGDTQGAADDMAKARELQTR